MINYDEENQVFQIHTKNTSYVIGLADGVYPGHIYYGRKMEDARCGFLMRTEEAPFTPAVCRREKASFADTFSTEYSTWGVGDFRESCLDVRTAEGQRGCELRYQSHRILDEKLQLPGLPSLFAGKSKAQTLELFCTDEVIGLEVTLRYSIFEDSDAIIRSVSVKNKSEKPLALERVLSACIDMDQNGFEMISLHGAWARERGIVRRLVTYGKQSIGSVRGESSHQENPFLALVTPGTNQEMGEVYAMNFVYSGNFLAQAELSQFDRVRMVMGIHPQGFEWHLAPGECFDAPEVV